MNRTINDTLEFHKLRPPIVRFLNNNGELLEDLPSPKRKTALLIRYGAIGDMVFCSPIPRLLKAQGYYVVVNTQERGVQILQHNPYIDEFWYQEKNVISGSKLDQYWKMLGEGFDKVVNLTQSIEEKMLKTPQSKDYDIERTKDKFDRNYFDVTAECSGFDVKGLRGELYFSPEEERYAQEYLNQYKDRFKVLIVPAGSSWSKAWPFWNFLFVPHEKDLTNGRFPSYYGLYSEIPEMLTISTGDDWGRLLGDWPHPNHLNGTGSLTIRQSVVLAKYVDLVIGPDTGIVNAAGCFDTPKICFLGQTTRTNIAKYWVNDYSIEADAKCAPCYNLVYNKEQCMLGNKFNHCLCMESISPEDVAKQIKKVYKQWKRARHKRIVTPVEHYKEARACQQLRTL